MRSERLWQTARVVEDADGRRWLEFQDVSRCRRCRAGRGCGAAQWSRLFGGRGAHRLPLPDTEARLSGGMTVRVGVSAAALVGAAMRAYLIPLAAFVSVLVAVDRLGAGEPVALVSGLAGALLVLRAGRGGALRSLEPEVEAIDPACGALESWRDGEHL